MIVTNHSLFGYILHAGFVVKCVMLILLVGSIASWTLIFQRMFYFKKIQQKFKHFESRFWTNNDLMQLYKQVGKFEHDKVGIGAIFYSGYKEYLKLTKHNLTDPQSLRDASIRAMQIALMRQLEQLEKHLPFLASVGSTSPYIGLFGTVWGIMTAFQSLGGAGQATIAMVAPGISEALIATAMGLFAAIPAVLAYNRYTYSVELLMRKYETFQEEFANFLYQQSHSNLAGIGHEK